MTLKHKLVILFLSAHLPPQRFSNRTFDAQGYPKGYLRGLGLVTIVIERKR